MSQTLIVEVSDQVYAALQCQAEKAGTSPDKLVGASLEHQFRQLGRLPDANALLTDAEKQSARERFERHFGAVNLGYPTGIDNESIDADLGKEYADTHEGG